MECSNSLSEFPPTSGVQLEIFIGMVIKMKNTEEEKQEKNKQPDGPKT